MPRKKRKAQAAKASRHSWFVMAIDMILGLLLVLGTVLAAYGNLVLVPDGRQEREEKISAYRGTLTPAYTINTSEPFTVSIGTLSTNYTADELDAGIDLTKHICIEAGGQTVSLPVSTTFENNIVHVFAEIKDENNEIIGKVVDNDWSTVSPESTASVWDRNYNAYAFELIDGDKMPVLQLLIGQPNRIDIGFSLFSQGISIYFGITTGTMFNPSTPEDFQRIRSSTLFKYPSSEHLGELVNSTGYPTSSILADANAKIQLGVAFSIAGTIFIAIFGVCFVPLYMINKRAFGE
jgi:hypothetical protein